MKGASMPVYHRNDRYPLVRIESAQDWDALLELCDGYLDPGRLDQFRRLLGETCKTVIVERDYVCKDYSLPLPPGQSFSDGYLTGLVINDDNSMPYQVLPKAGYEHQFTGNSHVSGYRLSGIDSFVVPLYEKIYLAAEDVERWTLALLKDHYLGAAAKSALQLDDLVIRVFLTTARAYKAERRALPLPHALSQIYTQIPMPRFVWIAELSTKELYPCGKILGEIIWDATASAEDILSWLLIHYPECLLVNERASVNTGIWELALKGREPYALYRHNLQEVS
jgi:hypothetical protein